MSNNRQISTIVVTVTPSTTPSPAPSNSPGPKSTEASTSKKEPTSKTEEPTSPPAPSPEPTSVPPPPSTLTTLPSIASSSTAPAIPSSTDPVIPPPSGLPPKAILGLSIGIPLVVLLVIVMGIIHYVLKRKRKNADEYNARRARDAEAQRIANANVSENLKRMGSTGARAVNAALVRPGNEYLAGREPRLPNAGVPTVESPINRAMSMSPTSMSPSGVSHVDGRLRWPEGVQGLEAPAVQVYDPAGRRTIYHG